MPFGLSYYVVPLLSGFVWAGTLISMLVYWSVTGKPQYPSMSIAEGQTIAYISDVGAQRLKPLFIAGSVFTTVTFDLVFITEKWLRHRGRLAPNTTKSEKIFSILSVIFSIVGAAGLIFLSIFDTLRHPTTHQRLLVVFIAGYLLTAIFVCCEYQRLGMHLRQYRLLRISFWVKLVWVLLFVGLAVAFGTTEKVRKLNTSAILEWSIGFLYALFVASFAIDFLPAIRTRGHDKHFPTASDLQHGTVPRNHLGGPAYDSDASFGSGQPMSQANQPGRYYEQPARNF